MALRNSVQGHAEEHQTDIMWISSSCKRRETFDAIRVDWAMEKRGENPPPFVRRIAILNSAEAEWDEMMSKNSF